MRNGLLGFLGILIVGTSPLLGQSETPRAVLGFREPEKTAAAPVIKELQAPANADAYQIWGRGEYLLWWVKGAPLPVPIVTTGDPTVGFPALNTAGAIGQPGTQVLLGNSTQHFGAFSGMRFTLGAWLDCERTVGIEGSGFLLERRTSQFTAASDGAGNPTLYFPIFSGIAGAERGIAIADPLRRFAGDVFVNSTLELWGAELNGSVLFMSRPGLEITLLAGFRYADLKENLAIHNSTIDLVFGNATSQTDAFDTRNQFYGGQLGGRASWQSERLSLDLTGKFALGATHQVVNINGEITQFGPNALVPPGLGTSPGALFTQPSNIGRRTTNQFTVLPSLEAKLGYQVSSRLRASVGYDLMYWNQVVRPGNQIDRRVNLSQNAVLDPNGAGVLVGPAVPTPLFQRTDFWAQGVSFGLEFRY
jgi:hypothetical protein